MSRIMPRIPSRVRNSVALAGSLCALLAWCPTSFALDPSLDISQYAHTSWKIRDGLIKGTVHAITQTADGYLWLGTEFGLLRFDGVRVTSWPPSGQTLSSSNIWTLLAAHDGTLWIGTNAGLASWKNGTLTQYAELDGHRIYALTEDHEGTIWAGTYAMPAARLCSIGKGKVECFGADGVLGIAVTGLREDSKGNLWVAASGKLWRWNPGPRELLPSQGEINFFSKGDDSEVLIASNGIQRLLNGKLEGYSIPGNVPQFRPSSILRDRDGGLWIGALQGLLHVHQGRTDRFVQSNGLSGDNVFTLFEDREGNIWVGTFEGLDRFRDLAVATFSRGQGLPSDFITSVLADRDGSILIGDTDGFRRWSHGRVTESIRIPDGGVQSLFQDTRGRIWISSRRGVDYAEDGKLVQVKGVSGSSGIGFAEDVRGGLWITQETFGLFHLDGASDVQHIPLAQLQHRDLLAFLVPNRLQGGVWVGFQLGGIVHFDGDQIRTSYGTADGLSRGRVNNIVANPDGTLWVATDGGLSYFDNGRIATLTSRNGLPCDAVFWIVEDDTKSFWLNMSCGLVRIPRDELVARVATADKGGNSQPGIQLSVFDNSDGVRSVDSGSHSGYTPQVAKASDGKLWMATPNGVRVVDPRRLPFNNLPPPVHIEKITVDDKSYDDTSITNGNLRLPARARSLELDYTALSLVAPEKIRFRYKLENLERGWQDVGTRRQAFYSNLPPGNYRFRVIASNNSGVWNETGAALDFTVDPAYYQTTWFRLLAVAAFLALLAGLYQLRLRHLTRQYNIRLEERVNERTRIARELHDTLLQSFQGALLKFYAVGYQLPEGSEAKESLDEVIEQVRNAIAEGRDALQGLRSSRLASNDLAETMSALAKAIGEQLGQNVPDFRVQMEGTPRRLAAPVLDEIYQFANEALRNAFKHANATRIELEILYDRSQFRLRIRDDGKGIAPEVLRDGGRPGHYGLTGMHERARQAGGKVAVWSEVDSGTEVELTIPSKIAYAKSPTKRWPTPW